MAIKLLILLLRIMFKVIDALVNSFFLYSSFARFFFFFKEWLLLLEEEMKLGNEDKGMSQ